MYEGIYEDITAWRYGNPGLLCGGMIGMRWQENLSFWQEHIILGDRGNVDIKYRSHDQTNMSLRDSTFCLNGLVIMTLETRIGTPSPFYSIW